MSLQLQAVVSLNRSGFESGLSSISALVHNTSSAMMMAFGGVAGEILAMGRAFGPVGVAVGSLKEAVTVGASFEQQMANVASVTGLMGSELDQVSDAARNMAKTTRFTASEAAEALYSLGSAGENTADGLINTLKPALLLAGATMSDTKIATETMTAALANFQLPAAEATRVANQLAGTIASSPATMDRLADALKYAGPAAAAFGISLEKTVAEIGAFHLAGIRGEMAGTSFRTSLIELSNISQKAGSEVGAALRDWDASSEGLTGAVKRLNAAGVDTSVVIQEMGKRAGPGMAALMKQGVDAMDKMADRIKKNADVAKMYEIQQATLTGKFYKFKSAIEDVHQALFVALSPTLQAITEKATALALAFGDLIMAALAGDWDTVKDMITGAFNAALDAVRNFIQSLNVELVLPNTFAAIRNTVAALSYAFDVARTEAAKMFTELKNVSWADVLTKAIETLDDALALLVTAFNVAVQGIKNIIVIAETLAGAWASLDSGTKILIQTFVGTFSVLTAMQTVSTAMTVMASGTIPKLIGQFAAMKTSTLAYTSTTNLAAAGAAAFGVGLGTLIREIPGVAESLDNLVVKTGQWLGLFEKQDMTLQDQIEHYRRLRIEKNANRKATEEAIPKISEENAALMESVLAMRDIGSAVRTATDAMMKLPPAAKEVKKEIETASGFWDGYQSSINQTNEEMLQSIITMRTFAPAAGALEQVFAATGVSLNAAAEATKETRYSLQDLWGMLSKFKELKITAFDVSAFTSSIKQLQQSLQGVGEFPELKLPDFSSFTIPDISNRQVNSFIRSLRALKTGLMNLNFGELGNIDIDIRGGDAASGKLDEIISILKGAKGVVWA